jgi:hypothetical protein
LRADAEPVAVLQLDGILHGSAVDLHAVAAVQIIDDRAIALEDDACMMPRDEGVLDRHVAIGASPEDGRPAGEVELLKQKP